ncbi:FKBP-type peptidyl-prolyl cis-trans isomerase [Pedobacter frigoris]|uniref:FKBP-type peptidyl-prolyl cis-trans isomerase n=1 Tax=Pedobacter frigoris TaxID=2571272 RepID=UPI0029310390|nr:FKBP-type peptidyl-prolyl cis-trans isomerase [Pedobacter frigoris]
MNNIKSLLLLVFIAAGITACKKGKTVDVETQFKADTIAIRNYITSNNIPAIKHSSGVFYQIIAPGTGDVKYTANSQISAAYQGKIMNGAIFDDSKGAPIDFSLGRVIQGWQIGIPLIQKGGKIRLLIPSYYGYGTSGTGPIPGNAILDFDITLINVQ